MNRTEILGIVNRARGFNVKESELPFSEAALEAVNDLEILSLMVENQGGVLRSRQVISLVILLAEMRVADRS